VSERFTEVTMPTGYTGLALRGRVSREEAIRQYRDFLRRELESMQSAMDTPDDDLRVVTYVGLNVRRNLEVVK
jgi:hypothetical protein